MNNKMFKFGEDVEGYNIPVLNKREIRASAGILFVFMLISFLLIIFKGNFLMIKYVIVVFLTDMIIRVFVNPHFSPSLIIGRLIVRNQTPEYVKSQQKKFAWVIGIVLASIMFVFLVVVNSYSPINGIGCLLCLTLLFFESAFGICLGCKVYKLFYKEKAQYCPREVCDVKTRHNIQKISWTQLLIVLGLIAYILLIGYTFNSNFSTPPHDLFGIFSAKPTK